MLTLHRAERSDVLADALAQVLRSPLDDPFAVEVVAVPAKGVERWLTGQPAAAEPRYERCPQRRQDTDPPVERGTWNAALEPAAGQA